MMSRPGGRPADTKKIVRIFQIVALDVFSLLMLLTSTEFRALYAHLWSPGLSVITRL